MFWKVTDLVMHFVAFVQQAETVPQQLPQHPDLRRRHKARVQTPILQNSAMRLASRPSLLRPCKAFTCAGFNLKLSSVASDWLGVSGRRIIEALIAGEDSPELLSWKVRGSLRKKEKRVRESLKGYFTDFHRLMLRLYYRHYEFISGQMQEWEAEITRRMEPYSQQITALMRIPGVERIIAWHLIAELGADMSVFPDADHCASWAGVRPGSGESAGKQFSGRTKKGNQYLRRAHPGGLGSLALQRGLPARVLLPGESAAGMGKNHRGGGPQNSGHCLLHPQNRDGIGRRLFRPAPPRARGPAPGAPPAAARPKRYCGTSKTAKCLNQQTLATEVFKGTACGHNGYQEGARSAQGSVP